MERMKECTKCKITKPLSSFNKHRHSPDGHAYQCKECNKVRSKAFRASPSGIYTTIKGRQDFYRNHGDFKDKPFKITRKEFIVWYNSQPKICAYCDLPEDKISKFYDAYNKWSSRLSVDAKDNNVGYILENIVLCCRRCNSLKSDLLSYDEMREFAQKYIKPKWQAQLESINGEDEKCT